MTTWISKAAAALLGGLLLSGCEDLPQGGGLLAGLSLPGADDAAPPPLTQALMMRGAVTLVPPTGFCIDPRSLNQSFALMARCDTLGAATGSRGAPLGIMTISFTQNRDTSPLPSAEEITLASGLSAPERLRDRGDHAIFSTRGEPPLEGLDQQHWRAVADVGGFVMGAALFGPAQKRAVSLEGAGLLEELIDRTQAKTDAG